MTKPVDDPSQMACNVAVAEVITKLRHEGAQDLSIAFSLLSGALQLIRPMDATHKAWAEWFRQSASLLDADPTTPVN